MTDSFEERQPLTSDQIQEWGYFVEKRTTLSPQEAQVFVRLFEMHKNDICEDLDIDRNHLDSVIHRINKKAGRAQKSAEIMKVLSSRVRHVTEPIPVGHALVGCSGPDCSEDVETAVVNKHFDDFYTKTVNLYDNEQEAGRKRTLQFCSLDCLNGFEELARR